MALVAARTLEGLDATPGRESDVAAVCAPCLRGLAIVCCRKAAALELLTEGYDDAFSHSFILDLRLFLLGNSDRLPHCLLGGASLRSSIAPSGVGGVKMGEI